MARLATVVLVVRDLERALAVYEEGLGFARTGAVRDVPSAGARQVVLRTENCLVELIEPHDETKPPGMFLRARGEGVFGLEVGVEDVDEVRERLDSAQVKVIGTPVDPAEAGGAAGRSRCFVGPRDAQGILLEVVSAPAGGPA